MVLVYDKDQPSALLRLTASGPVAAGPQPLYEGHPLTLVPVSDRAWEAQLPLSAGNDHFDALFIVFGTFGFAVYL